MRDLNIVRTLGDDENNEIDEVDKNNSFDLLDRNDNIDEDDET